VNQFADEQLDPRPWATFKRNHPAALPSARRSVLPPHCLAVLVGSFRGRSLVPAGGEPFNTAAHAATLAADVEAQRAEQPA
jgi:hypothetical protein